MGLSAPHAASLLPYKEFKGLKDRANGRFAIMIQRTFALVTPHLASAVQNKSSFEARILENPKDLVLIAPSESLSRDADLQVPTEAQIPQRGSLVLSVVWRFKRRSATGAHFR